MVQKSCLLSFCVYRSPKTSLFCAEFAYAANYRHLSVLDGTAQPRKVASAQFFLEDNNGPSLNNAT